MDSSFSLAGLPSSPKKRIRVECRCGSDSCRKYLFWHGTAGNTTPLSVKSCGKMYRFVYEVLFSFFLYVTVKYFSTGQSNWCQEFIELILSELKSTSMNYFSTWWLMKSMILNIFLRPFKFARRKWMYEHVFSPSIQGAVTTWMTLIKVLAWEINQNWHKSYCVFFWFEIHPPSIFGVNPFSSF